MIHRGFKLMNAVLGRVQCWPVVLGAFVLNMAIGDGAVVSAGDRRSPIIEKRVEEVLRKQASTTGAAGIAFGVVQGDSVVAECYTGFASVKEKRRIDSHTVFNWASLSKSLTAVCALKLAEQGKIKLDDDINGYVPELDLQGRVTFRQLLENQGGIGGYDENPKLLELQKVDRKDLTQKLILDRIDVRKPIFAPGTRQEYSSPGFILLSIAMERAAKKTFSGIVDEIITAPLKLTSLRIGSTSDDDVSQYRLVNGSREFIDPVNNDWRLGAGAVKSNLPDALAFASALIKSSVLSAESSKELFKRRSVVKFEDDYKGPVIGVTYGFMRVGEGAEATITSSGTQAGVRALLVIYPRTKMASVIFANSAPLDLEKIHLEATQALMEK